MQQRLPSTGRITRVLVGASSVVTQAGLAALLATSAEIEVVGSAIGMAPLGQQAEQLQPDVVLLEWNEAESDTIATLLMAESTEPIDGGRLDPGAVPAIVVLVDEWPQTTIATTLRLGVRGLLPSDATASEIIGAIAAVVSGLTVLHPDLVEPLLPVLPAMPRAAATAPSEALTNREIEVLSMLAEGLGNKAIAHRLTISEHTVKFHIGSIFGKLNASSRTEAVILGARQGLILL